MAFICSKCNKKETEINQNTFICEGKLDDQMIDDEVKEYEEQEILEGEIAYYYFEASNEDIIRGNTNAGALARSLCKECIKDSIDNTFKEKDPHYCDGVYLTFNKELNTSKPEVKCCHGEYVAKRKLRAKFRINKPEEFLKIYKTGGVIKTNEKANNYKKEKLILLNKDEKDEIATYIGIQEFKNNKWRMKK